MTVCAFDAVIFDFDGVLLDSEPVYLAATNEVLAREGRYLSPEENARYSGARYRDMLAALIPRLGLAYDVEVTTHLAGTPSGLALRVVDTGRHG